MPTIPRHRIDLKYAAQVGQKMYEEQYRSSLEPQEIGKYLALDIESGTAALGKSSTEAMAAGKKAAPGGFFYVIRIGFPTTFAQR